MIHQIVGAIALIGGGVGILLLVYFGLGSRAKVSFEYEWDLTRLRKKGN